MFCFSATYDCGRKFSLGMKLCSGYKESCGQGREADFVISLHRFSIVIE
jgi:hypothetical protein